MEAQRAPGSSPEKKSRSESDAIKPNTSFSSNENPLGTPREPIYPNQSPSNLTSHVGETMEGFSPSGSRDAGMKNLEGMENFGSRFQMPDAQTSDNFLTAPTAPKAEDESSSALDVQATVDAIQDLVQKIRANLESAEQQELEELLRQGAELISKHYKTLSHVATEQVSTLKSEIRDNPYRSLMAAVKVGMALSQVYYQHKEARLLSPEGEQA